MGAFSTNVTRWVAKTQVETHAQAKYIILELFSRVVQRTPVDTGRARGNWSVSFGESPALYVGGPPDKGDGTNRILSKLQEFKLGQTAWLTNGLPYIRVLEYGEYPNPSKGEKTENGFSKRAPQGMVRITVAEFGQIVRGRQ